MGRRSIDPSTNQKEEIPMKKILALPLALMLALSLTAALAADPGETTLDLQLNVTPQIVNNVNPAETWNVDIIGNDLTWNLIQTDTQTGTVDGWNPSKDSYDDVTGVGHTYGIAVPEGEKMSKRILISSNSNFDVSFKCGFVQSAANAFSFDGISGGILINKSNTNNYAEVFVKLDPKALNPDNPISNGPAGSVTIMLAKSGDVYPYVP